MHFCSLLLFPKKIRGVFEKGRGANQERIKKMAKEAAITPFSKKVWGGITGSKAKGILKRGKRLKQGRVPGGAHAQAR